VSPPAVPQTAPPDTQQQVQADQQQATTAALVILLLSGPTAAELAQFAATTLSPLGLTAEAVGAAVSLAGRLDPPASGLQPASAFVDRSGVVRRAQYIASAARRYMEAPDARTWVGAERRYLAQHLDAGRARREAAGKVDEAAARFGPVLGWHAVMDGATTPECRAAHSKNFAAARPPAIGYPSTLHGGACRCRPGPPWPHGEMLR